MNAGGPREYPGNAMAATGRFSMASGAPLPLADALRPIALELRHLRLVLAIEQEGGITRAGERLHLTQSALSHQLREIEVRLAVPLFLRVRKRLVLTDAGRKLLAAAQRLLGEVVELED